MNNSPEQPKLKLVWFNGLDEVQKEEFKKTLLNSRTLQKQILRFLSSRYEMIERKGFREEDYDSSDWTHKQAFNNGRLAILKEIADLFDF